MPLIGKYLFDGNPVSVHLPLHRTAAACIQVRRVTSVSQLVTAV
jgi:hypothetical protein